MKISKSIADKPVPFTIMPHSISFTLTCRHCGAVLVKAEADEGYSKLLKFPPHGCKVSV